MSKVLAFPHKEQVNEQASIWIARLDRGLSEAEHQAFVQWMQEDDANRQALLEMAALWDKMDSLARLAELFETPVCSRSPVGKPAYWAAAAALAVIALMLWSLAGVTPDTRQLLTGVYETAIGERSTVNLPDGSRVVLNTNSRLEVKYNAGQRLFLLERGEAHIEVAHGDSRPLSFLASDRIVQAVGTAFNVKIMNNKHVELLVTEGKVRVARRLPQAQPLVEEKAERLPASAMAVARGEKIVLGSARETLARVEEADILVHLSWRQGNLIFRGETLEQALAEISRYTSVEFVVLDEQIKQERIAGLFKAGDVKGLLATLAQNFNIDSELRGTNKIILRARQ